MILQFSFNQNKIRNKHLNIYYRNTNNIKILKYHITINIIKMITKNYNNSKIQLNYYFILN